MAPQDDTIDANPTLRRKRFANARRFSVFYGYGRPPGYEDSDVLVVEPTAHAAETVAAWRAEGRLVLAYLSVIEVTSTDQANSVLANEVWLTAGEKRVKNEAYRNFLADIRRADWRAILQYRLGMWLNKHGYDGIFMDTLSDLEWPVFDAHTRRDLQLAAARWLGEVRNRYPHHIFVQNNGLVELAPKTAHLVDAFCWENPDMTPEIQSWNERIAEQLSALRSEHYSQILVLCETGENEESRDDIKTWANQHGFLFQEATPNYL